MLIKMAGNIKKHELIEFIEVHINLMKAQMIYELHLSAQKNRVYRIRKFVLEILF